MWSHATRTGTHATCAAHTPLAHTQTLDGHRPPTRLAARARTSRNPVSGITVSPLRLKTIRPPLSTLQPVRGSIAHTAWKKPHSVCTGPEPTCLCGTCHFLFATDSVPCVRACAVSLSVCTARQLDTAARDHLDCVLQYLVGILVAIATAPSPAAATKPGTARATQPVRRRVLRPIVVVLVLACARRSVEALEHVQHAFRDVLVSAVYRVPRA